MNNECRKPKYTSLDGDILFSYSQCLLHWLFAFGVFLLGSRPRMLCYLQTCWLFKEMVTGIFFFLPRLRQGSPSLRRRASASCTGFIVDHCATPLFLFLFALCNSRSSHFWSAVNCSEGAGTRSSLARISVFQLFSASSRLLF